MAACVCISLFNATVYVQPTIGVHGYRPVYKEQVNVRCFQKVQTLLQTLLDTGVECAPELAGNEEIFSLHNPPRNDILEGIANLVLILVAEGTVNVPVAALNGMDDSLLDFTRPRLPRSQTEGGDGGARVEGDRSVHFGLRVEDTLWCTLQHKLGKGRIHRKRAGVVLRYICA